MNTGEFLIAAVYEFASAAIFAVAAEAPEEADSHALTDDPPLYVSAKRVDLSSGAGRGPGTA